MGNSRTIIKTHRIYWDFSKTSMRQQWDMNGAVKGHSWDTYRTLIGDYQGNTREIIRH